MRVLTENGIVELDIPHARAEIARMAASHAEFRRGGGARARRPNGASIAAAEREKYAGPLAELRAQREGHELGRRFAGNPHAAVRALGIPIERYPAAVLAQMAGQSVFGRFVPARRVIQLVDNLSGRDEVQTLAHEIAHAQGIGIDDDAHAETYMRAFMAAVPNPMMALAAAREAWEDRLMRVAARR